jgi:hypothetical protein
MHALLAIRQYVTLLLLRGSHGIHVNSNRENQKYGQLYRIFFRLVLLHVLSNNKTCLAYAMVDVPSAFDLAPDQFRHGAYHVDSSKSKGALI